MTDLNSLVVLGPTASGKTRLAVRLARHFGGEIVSADSRQVYRGLDIGSGKDLAEYAAGGPPVPYHLIDVVDLDAEYNVFAYQQAFYDAFERVRGRGALPVVAGGTGLYIEAVLKGYRMVEVPESPTLRTELAALSDEQLAQRLLALRPDQHNTTDLRDRERLVRAIEIAEHADAAPPPPAPAINALIIGARWPRKELHRRIETRLRERLNGGMIEEVEELLARGVSPERLRLLGLEYRYVTEFFEGRIQNRNDLRQKLGSAIRDFAKRQETWFRRMERRGAAIQWVDRADADAAIALAEQAGLPPARPSRA